MYNCKYCDKEFKDKGNLRKHEKYAHEESAYTESCPHCDKKLTPSGVVVHVSRCRKNPDRIPTEYELKLQQGRNKLNPDMPGDCKFCGKHCHNQNSLRNHERVCKINPNRQSTIMESKEWQEEMRSRIDYTNPWNKGKTSAEDPRIVSGQQGVERALKAVEKIRAEGRIPGQASTAEKEAARRNNISMTMHKNPNSGGIRHGSGRGKKGWYRGFFCDSTYELVYVIYNLDHNIEFKKCDKVYTYEYQGKTHKYYPDFELPDGSIVETKGYHSEVVDLKTASVTDRPIKVLFEKDLKYAFDWVKQNYTYSNLSDLYD